FLSFSFPPLRNHIESDLDIASTQPHGRYKLGWQSSKISGSCCFGLVTWKGIHPPHSHLAVSLSVGLVCLADGHLYGPRHGGTVFLSFLYPTGSAVGLAVSFCHSHSQYPEPTQKSRGRLSD